jgi:CBS domain-containing protein
LLEGIAMHASDVMIRKVITAAPDTPIEDVARLLLDNRISGVPVVQYGAVVGMVSESDLVRRAAAEGTPSHPSWLSFLASAGTQAAVYVRSHGRHARDIMATPVLSVPDGMSIHEIAALMEHKRVTRVPVVDADGMLIGIITRSNLLRAMASQVARPRDSAADDAAIHTALVAELRRQGWGAGAEPSNAIVEEGVVHLWGRVRNPDVRRAMVVAAEGIPGVISVADHLDTSVDEEAIDPMERPNWPTPSRP